MSNPKEKSSFYDYLPLITALFSGLFLSHLARAGFKGLSTPNHRPPQPLTEENLDQQLLASEIPVAARILLAAHQLGYTVYGNQIEVKIDPPINGHDTTLPDLALAPQGLINPLATPEKLTFIELTTIKPKRIPLSQQKTQQADIMAESGLPYLQLNAADTLKQFRDQSIQAVVSGWLNQDNE